MGFIKSNTLKIALKLAVSIALVVFVFLFVGVEKIYNELVNIKTRYLLISLFFSAAIICFKVIRWKRIIRMFGVSLSFKDSLQYSLISTAFGRITPSTIGEFVKVKYLTDKTGIKYLKSFITVATDKGFDLLAMAFLGLLGLAFLSEITNIPYLFAFLFVLYVAALIAAYIFFFDFMGFAEKIIPRRLREDFRKIRFTRRLYLISMILSVIAWILIIIMAWFIFKSIGISAPFLIVVAVIPLMALSSLVPISLGGVGVRELIAISFLLLIGIDAEKSAVFSLFYTFIGSGIPAIFGAFLYFFYKKQPKRSAVK